MDSRPPITKRLESGIALRDDPIAIPVLEEGLETKEFLSLPPTLKWFREEIYVPDGVIERGTLEEWRQKGRKDAARRASERVGKILQTHVSEPLDEKIAAALQDLMRSEARGHGLQDLPPTE